jgi:hypothetical protein
MGNSTTNRRAGLARRALVVSLGVIVLIALVWLVAGAVAQPRMLAKYRDDYESAKFARNHPSLARIFSKEETVQASEVFARDYEALETSNVFMAPLRSTAVAVSHDRYQELVNPTEREKFEKERKEREKEEAEEDAKRIKEIREEEKNK